MVRSKEQVEREVKADLMSANAKARKAVDVLYGLVHRTKLSNGNLKRIEMAIGNLNDAQRLLGEVTL